MINTKLLHSCVNATCGGDVCLAFFALLSALANALHHLVLGIVLMHLMHAVDGKIFLIIRIK